MQTVAWLTLPYESRLVPPGAARVAVDAIHASIELPPTNHLARRIPLENALPGLDPFELRREPPRSPRNRSASA